MKNVYIHKNATELAANLADRIIGLINGRSADRNDFFMAVSGGNTPKKLFARLAGSQEKITNWNALQLFWVDERCVPPDNEQSNYRMIRETLLDKISLSEKRIHRMKGEEEPGAEAVRYGDLVASAIPRKDSIPAFDLILLGMGADGHTASIFPGSTDLFESGKHCEVSVHPETGQTRITLTGRVLNNARHVIFMVSGSDKAEMLLNVLKGEGSTHFPAALVRPVHGTLEWFIDQDAITGL